MRKIPWLLMLAPVLLVADEVYLKGAGEFSGKIVEQTDTMVTINIGDGVIGVPMSRVERIVRGHSALDEYEERAGRLEPGDVAGWRNLGHWASQKGLPKQASEAYENVIAIAPGDAAARQALGFVLHEGRWLTEEESYRARGFVKYDGEWMTPAEAQIAETAAGAERARREAEQRANEAAIAASEAEQRAEEAEERAREAEEERSRYPVYWGGWGYGVNYWPTTYTYTRRDFSR